MLVILALSVLPLTQCCRQVKKVPTVTAITDSTVCMPLSKIKALVGAADYWKQKYEAKK